MPISVLVTRGADLEQEVDEDISRFDEFFRSLGNESLSRFESAAIKTYLHWKTHGEPSSPPQTPTAEKENAT